MVDNFIQRAVLVISAVLAFVFAGCIVYLSVQSPPRSVPDAVLAAYTGAAGFITGVLVNMRTGRQPEEPPQEVVIVPPAQPPPPQQVEVVNEPENPVPTTEGEK